MEDRTTELIRRAFGGAQDDSDTIRKSVYKVKVQREGDSTQRGFACAVQRLLPNNEVRYFLVTSDYVLSKDDFSQGTTVTADRCYSNWHTGKHRITTHSSPREVEEQNGFIFVPLDQKPQHYLRFDNRHQKVNGNPALVVDTFSDQKFTELDFVYMNGRYKLEKGNLALKDMKDIIGSSVFLKKQSSDIVMGVVGLSSEDGEVICPKLFGKFHNDASVNVPKVQPESRMLLSLVKSQFGGLIDALASRYCEGTQTCILSQVQNMVESSANESGSRALVITAQAGIGKSVLAATVCKIMKKQGRLAASHFIQHRNMLRAYPRMILESLARHLCDTVPGFQEQLELKLRQNLGKEMNRMNCEELFTLLLEEPLNLCNFHQRDNFMVVIDALDECDANKKVEFVNALFDKLTALPSWIRFFITTRPSKTPLPRTPGVSVIQIKPTDFENVRGVKMFLFNGLRQIYGGARPQEIQMAVNDLVDRFEALFLFAYFVIDIAKETDVELSCISKIFPKGISSVYEKYFSRLQEELNVDEETFFNFLEAIAAAEAPLPEPLVLQILGFTQDSHRSIKIARTALSHISVLLPVENNHVTIFHRSVAAWLAGGPNHVESAEYQEEELKCIDGSGDQYCNHNFRVNDKAGHRTLARHCFLLQQKAKSYSRLPLAVSNCEIYALSHGFKHMIKAGGFENQLKECVDDLELLTTCLSTSYPEATVKTLDILLEHFCSQEGNNFSFSVGAALAPKGYIDWNSNPWNTIDTLQQFVSDLTRGLSFILSQTVIASSLLQSAINFPSSSCIKNHALELINTPKYANYSFIEFTPKHQWSLPDDLISNIVVHTSSTGNLAVVSGTNISDPRDTYQSNDSGPLQEIVAVVNIKEGLTIATCTDSFPLPPLDISVSPDDTTVILATAKGTLELRDSQTLSLQVKLEEVKSCCATSCCFTPCGERVVAGYSNGSVRVWDIKTATIQVTIKRHTGNVVRCIMSRHGKLLIGAAKPGILTLWHSLADTSPVILSKVWLPGYCCVSFSPSNDKIVAVCKGERDLFHDFQVFSAATGALLNCIPRAILDIRGFAFLDETHVVVSERHTSPSYHGLELIDIERSKSVCFTNVSQDVYWLVKRENDDCITGVCTRRFSPRFNECSRGGLVLNIRGHNVKSFEEDNH